MNTEERLETLEKELARRKRFNRCLIVGLSLCLGIGFVVWAFGPDMAKAQTDFLAALLTRVREGDNSWWA